MYSLASQPPKLVVNPAFSTKGRVTSLRNSIWAVLVEDKNYILIFHRKETASPVAGQTLLKVLVKSSRLRAKCSFQFNFWRSFTQRYNKISQTATNLKEGQVKNKLIYLITKLQRIKPKPDHIPEEQKERYLFEQCK